MVSVEYHDPVDWEVLPAYTVTGSWEQRDLLTAAPGSTLTRSMTIGSTTMQSWTKAETYARTVSESAELGFDVAGITGSQSVSSSVTRSVMNSVSQSISKSYGETVATTWTVGANAKVLWQFVIETRNNHHKNNGQKTVTHTNSFELTESPSHTPKCLPGFSIFDTGAQLCSSPDACIGPCTLPSSGCRPDKHRWCAYWAWMGFCQRSYVRWMNLNCHTSCECA